MRHLALILLIIVAGILLLANKGSVNSIRRLTVNLSAFGVESDTYPSIVGYIDFEHSTSECKRSYYDPRFKPSSYTLSQQDIAHVRDLLQHADIKGLKHKYTTERTDQPTSTITIYTDDGEYTIEDYGLVGDDPLKEIYGIVYKFEELK